MNVAPELLPLKQPHVQCQGHADALTDALNNLRLRPLNPSSYEHFSKLDLITTRLQQRFGALT